MTILNINSKLLKKEPVSDKTGLFEYSVPNEFTFYPGQFAGISVPPYPLRAYSILDIKDNKISFFIDFKTKSGYFEKTQVGDEINLKGSYGVFKVKDTPLRKVFICTGSGCTPFIPMIKKLAQDTNNFENIKVDLFFGARFLEDDYCYEFLNLAPSPNFTYTRCITQPEQNLNKYTNRFTEYSKTYKKGRVTEIVPLQNFDYANTEFYICGSDVVVNDMSAVLKNLGAKLIYIEKFGLAGS